MREVISYLPSEALLQIAGILDWNPVVRDGPAYRLSRLPREQRCAWLARNRDKVIQEIRLTAGHPIANLLRRALGRDLVSYNQLLGDIAKRLRVPEWNGTDEELESGIVRRLWATTLQRLAPEAPEELLRRAREEAGAGLAAGPDLYIQASTLLGAINGALVLGLGCGAFIGMSKIIAAAAGPAGWLFFIQSHFVALREPWHKKLIPIVLLISAYRQDLSLKLVNAFETGDATAWVRVIAEMQIDPVNYQNQLDYLERVSSAGKATWPWVQGWSTVLSLAMFLKEPEQVADELIDFFAGELERNETAGMAIAESILGYFAQSAPGLKDRFLDLLLDADARFARLCYRRSTDFGATQHRAILTIVNGVLSILEPQRSHRNER